MAERAAGRRIHTDSDGDPVPIHELATGICGAEPTRRAWAISFHWWFRKRDDFPGSRDPGPGATVEMLARSKTVWLLCGQYVALVFPWYFLITWAPTFIDERFHLSAAESTGLKVLPLLFGGLGALTAGFISAPLTRWTGSVELTRRRICCVGFAGASAGLMLATLLHGPVAAVLASRFRVSVTIW